jgi:flagellar biosynthesis/type III secretory pathway M-ring protein FliF/YscJ
MKIALQDTLAEMIRAMGGVENAYVIYDIDQRPGLRMEKLMTATASVKLTAGHKLDEQRAEAIRQMIVGAIAGMKPENVTICDLNASAPPAVVQEVARPETVETTPRLPSSDGLEKNWKIYAAIGLALMLVPALWLLLRGRGAEQPHLARLDAGHDASAQGVPAPHFNVAPVEADSTFDEEISRLIEEDPQAAADVLRGWIAQAG